MFKTTQARFIAAILGFFLFLTVITVGIIMKFIAPQLKNNEHRLVLYEISAQAAAITEQMTRVQSQQRSITETVALLDSPQIDQQLAALVNQYGDSNVFGGGIWPLPGVREAGRDKFSTFFARDNSNVLRLNTVWNQPESLNYWEQPWHRDAQNGAKGECAWAKAYIDAASTQPRTNCAMPIYRNGTLWGVATIDVTLGFFNHLARTMSEAINGNVLIVEADGKVVGNSQPALDTSGMPNISELSLPGVETLQQMLAQAGSSSQEREYQGPNGAHTLFVYPVPASPWYVVSDIDSTLLSQQTSSILTRLGMVQIPLVLILMVILVAMIRTIMNNLRLLNNNLSALSAGGADLTQRLPESKSPEFNAVAQSFNGFIRYLQGLLQQVSNSAQAIASASHQITQGNIDLSSRTEEQSASLVQTAASMEEITGTVAQNADNAAHADELTAQASAVAQRGEALLSQTVEKMGDIESSSRRVSDIVNVIDGIAFQTNILALNAAVEAARAGEQGRGFAVVASEVRSLAQRSSGSAKEIRALIEESVSSVQEGSRLVHDTGATMDELMRSVSNVSALIGEVKTASREQSAGIEQVNTAVSQLEGTTQQNASLVEQVSVAARSMEKQANQLADVVNRFKL